MSYIDKEKNREASRKYYNNNKDKYKNYRRKSREKRRKLIRSFKDKPCADCGIKYPYYVMDFDHVRGKKEFLISMVVAKNLDRRGNLTVRHGNYKSGAVASEVKLLEEIAKCDVVCSNCHRIRTHKRMLNEKRKNRNNIRKNKA